MITRRKWIAGGLAVSGLLAANGAASQRLNNSGIRQSRSPIWPEGAPGGTQVTVTEQEVLRRPDAHPEDTAWVHVRTPTLTHFAPPSGKANGAAILIVPGGGYRRVGIGLGTLAIARYFANLGYSTYMLIYRLPADGWEAGPDAPLQDAQRALRIVHARAAQDDFDAERIAVIGGSAGGHLAARLLVRPELETYQPCDPIDSLPLTAAAGCLLYPVIASNGDYVHKGSRDQLVGPGASIKTAAPYAADVKVSQQTPPIFIAHAMDDGPVPWHNSVQMMKALETVGVPVSARFFDKGGHGFDLSGPSKSWTRDFIEFAERFGL